MTTQEYIDFIADYGTHVQLVYGNDIIQKRIHLSPYNSNYNYFPHKTSDCRRLHMEFEINGEVATIEECVKLINSYNRNKQIESILETNG